MLSTEISLENRIYHYNIPQWGTFRKESKGYKKDCLWIREKNFVDNPFASLWKETTHYRITNRFLKAYKANQENKAHDENKSSNIVSPKKMSLLFKLKTTSCFKITAVLSDVLVYLSNFLRQLELIQNIFIILHKPFQPGTMGRAACSPMRISAATRWSMIIVKMSVWNLKWSLFLGQIANSCYNLLQGLY